MSRIAMTSAGIPADVMKTTLPAEGREDLREYIASGAHNEPGSLTVVAPMDSKVATVGIADFTFYLTAKEMVLSGSAIYCISLVELSTLLSAHPDSNYIAGLGATTFDKVSSARVLAVSGFTDQGAQYLDPHQKQYVSAYLLKQVRLGKGLLLGCHAPTHGMNEWWPANFCAYVLKHANVFVVGPTR